MFMEVVSRTPAQAGGLIHFMWSLTSRSQDWFAPVNMRCDFPLDGIGMAMIEVGEGFNLVDLRAASIGFY